MTQTIGTIIILLFTIAAVVYVLFIRRYTPPDDDTWWSWYKRYLHSPRWKLKHDMKLEQSGHRCAMAGRGGCGGRLEVHHLNYKRVGNERMGDLQVLCQKHHKDVTR